MNTEKLQERLRLKAGVMEMGERIAWGSDTSLMREAADMIDNLEAKITAMAQKLERVAAIEFQTGESFLSNI